MKKIQLLFIALLTCQICMAQSWFQQNSGTDSTLNDVYFLNNDTGYACGWNTVLKTTDGGTNWLPLTTGFNNYFLTVRFLNANTGFLSGFLDGLILKTTDGGSTWINIGPSITGKKTYGTWFTSADMGFMAIGDYNPPLFPTMCNSKILRTQNSGATWDTVYSSSKWISFFSFPSSSVGYATRSDGHILKTIDGGGTWTLLDSLGHVWMSGVSFLNSDTGYVGGGVCNTGAPMGYVWKTIDGGSNWVQVYFPSTSDSTNGGYKLFFVDANTGYNLGASYDCTGVGGKLFKTIDGGSTWNKELIPRDSILGMYFTSATNGYAVGSNGAIIKYGIPPSLVNNVNNDSKIIVYPNPANDILNINVGNTSEMVEVMLYDMIGQVFETKSFDISPKVISLPVDKLSTGLYFYLVRNNGSIIRGKFLKE